MLSSEELEALKTPLKDLTPAQLSLAIEAKDKISRDVWKRNKNYGPISAGGQIIKDIDGFRSPVTGEMIEGRAALREHLKKTGCRIVDPSEARDHGIKERQ